MSLSWLGLGKPMMYCTTRPEKVKGWRGYGNKKGGMCLESYELLLAFLVAEILS